MNPDTWPKVKEIFEAALAQPPAQRVAFLARVCDGDEVLRREVESLLSSYEHAGSFMEAPALQAAAKSLLGERTRATVQRRLTPGQTINNFQIISSVGHGGMGDVYLAEDLRLRRKVALKLLPDDFTSDEDRLRRFEQEARAASALSHPNVCTIHEIGDTDTGKHYIVMEYVDGQTLRERMNGAPMPLAEACEITAQVASALGVAHTQGIVHRDIKPENIMIRRDGLVKVLDFGLAKLSSNESSISSPDATTLAKNAETEPGKVMGTVAYMSPEQARGWKVDARTDIFSLGVVLYELVAGKPPFDGLSKMDTMAAILNREADALSLHAPEVPRQFEEIINRSLRKDPDERYQTAEEMLDDLQDLKRNYLSGEQLGRSLAPDTYRKAYRPQAAASSTALPQAASTGADSTVASISSAEYFITQIKMHKRAALVTLSLMALIVAVSIASFFYFPRSNVTTINSMAVLPFINAGSDSSNDYLSDGLTESLINSLSHLPEMRMIARSSVVRYKGKETDPQAVGRELGVQAIVIGRVIQHGDDLSVSAELVDVNTNTRLWGEQYKRKLSDLLAIQSDISDHISARLRSRSATEPRRDFAKRYTENREAYQLYLKGRYFLERNDEASIQRAREYFQQAIATDQNYALAYTGLADTYLDQTAKPDDPSAIAAKAAVMKALEIDPSLSEAHNSLASILWHREWKFAEADREFRQAIDLNPSNAAAHHDFSHYLITVGRTEESFAESKRYLELDPISPPGSIHMGFYYLSTHQYDQAIEWEQKGLAMDTNFRNARYQLAEAYYYKGMFNEAVDEYLKAAVMSGTSAEMTAGLREAYQRGGISAFLQRWLDDEKQSGKRLITYVPKEQMTAKLYARLGKNDEALASLEKAVEDRDLFVDAFSTDADFDSLRSNARFLNLIDRIGLPR